MGIRIIESGILDTVQDLGRSGYADLGINPGGAMDRVAAIVANYLVGNDATEAVLEFHFPAATILFEKPTLIALTGADFSPVINDQPVPINTPIVVAANSLLRFSKMVAGARGYLALAGGFRLKPWLNSFSTNLKARAGGHLGRALQKGDILQCREPLPDTALKILPWHADTSAFYQGMSNIRIIEGREYALLTDCSNTIIEGNTFIISAQSDRMGYRMSGSPLQLVQKKEMLSSAVSRGTIQLLPNGQVIILMADHQTTGGYPRIAHVISADLPRLAQLQPHKSVRFKLVSTDDAETALMRQAHHLQQIKSACDFRLRQYLQLHGVD